MVLPRAAIFRSLPTFLLPEEEEEEEEAEAKDLPPLPAFSPLPPLAPDFPPPPPAAAAAAAAGPPFSCWRTFSCSACWCSSDCWRMSIGRRLLLFEAAEADLAFKLALLFFEFSARLFEKLLLLLLL